MNEWFNVMYSGESTDKLRGMLNSRIITLTLLLALSGHSHFSEAKDIIPGVHTPNACDLLLKKAFSNTALGKDWKSVREYRARILWNPKKFSDPKHHDPNNFLYIVHIPDSREHTLEDTIRYLNNGAESPKIIISASVMSNDGISTTFGGPYGLLLSSPPENILAAKDTDLGILNNWEGTDLPPEMTQEAWFKVLGPRDKYEKDIFNTFGIQEPHAMTVGSTEWNEVAIAKSSSAGSVQVTGLFYFQTENGVKGITTPDDKITELKVIAKKFNIPLVPIQSPFKY